jgi:transposase
MLSLKTILNHVEKHKGFCYHDIRWGRFREQRCIEILIHPRANSTAVCSQCEQPAGRYDCASKPRTFQYIPLWNIPVILLYCMRRVNCRRCGVKVEAVPWAQGKSRRSRSFNWFLAVWAKRLPWEDVARFFGTSWNRVYEAVQWTVEYGLEHRDLTGIAAIGIDEIAYQKGHKYLTMVYQIDHGIRRLLWVGKERTEETLRAFFKDFGQKRTQKLQFICTDMWKPYLNVIAQEAKQAINVLDRYHIMSTFNRKIDEVRRWEAKQLKEQGDEILKGSRWCFLKRPANLTGRQCETLKTLLNRNLKTVKAYLMKEDFQRFWNYVYPKNAGKFLDEWRTRAMRSRIEPMKDMARSLRSHRALLLNWFKAKKLYSSGVVEGLNNKVRTTTKRSYGFRTYEVLQVTLYHNLAALPLPPITHKFC